MMMRYGLRVTTTRPRGIQAFERPPGRATNRTWSQPDFVAITGTERNSSAQWAGMPNTLECVDGSAYASSGRGKVATRLHAGTSR